MAVRVVRRRRNHYNTASNKKRFVRTPGKKLVLQHVDKKAKHPHCGDCHCRLRGIPALRPKAFGLINKNKRTVSRPYGGAKCHKCVREKIMRAFLAEEKRVLKPAAEQPIEA